MDDIEELRQAAKTLRRLIQGASSPDWVPAVEERPDDLLTVGVQDEEGVLIAGGPDDMTDADARYISLLCPRSAVPLADWLRDVREAIEAGEAADPIGTRLVAPAIHFARVINQRNRRIEATGITRN